MASIDAESTITEEERKEMEQRPTRKRWSRWDQSLESWTSIKKEKIASSAFEDIDENVGNKIVRAFSVVASTLGIPTIFPFLEALCQSKNSWQARHTGIELVQQITILMGRAVVPHLRSLVKIIEIGLIDENQPQEVKKITALTLSALADAAAPYGIESFESVLGPLWWGIRVHSGKVLAAFLKACGSLLPLMEPVYASIYATELMFRLTWCFQSPDEDMKETMLIVVKQCLSTEEVEEDHIQYDLLPVFFHNFWVRSMALDRRNYKQLVDTTMEIAKKVGVVDVLGRLVMGLKDECEPYRRMVMETIGKILKNLGASDINGSFEELLIDGILYAFQVQSSDQTSDEANVMVTGFGEVVNALGIKVKPYLPYICGTIDWRLKESEKVMQQAADLKSRIADVIKQCQEEQLMGPEVLPTGSVPPGEEGQGDALDDL